jgi:hypothetical protein
MGVKRARSVFHTDRRSAVSDQDYGVPVPPSGPSTGCEPTTLVTDGRKPSACPPDSNPSPFSPSPSKTGREFEGGPLISAVGAVPLTSLDSIQNNRDKPLDPYRVRRCGKQTLLGISAKLGGVGRFFKLSCKCWNCPRCSPRKANKYRRAIARAAEQHKLSRLLTLTLDVPKLNGQDSTRYINEVFADFRTYLKRKLGKTPKYIRVLEYQKSGIAHLHVLLDTFLDQSWISETWDGLGGGRIVDIRRVDMHRVSHYLSKYLTKEMLMLAPSRARRVTTSRTIQLNPKKNSDWIWRLIHIPIQYLYEVHKCTANNVLYDIEGDLTGFESSLPMQ